MFLRSFGPFDGIVNLTQRISEENCCAMQLSATIKIADSELDYDHLIEHQSEFDAQRDHDVVVDLSHVEKITTTAFAQLIMLRNASAQAGHKFVIVGLRGQPQALYEMLKLRCLAMSS